VIYFEFLKKNFTDPETKVYVRGNRQ